jgi:predicted dehydrogenase
MKVAVVGYGYWGPNVVRSLCRLLGPKGVLVCDSRPERIERARMEQPGIATAPRWSDVLEDRSVDAIYLCTPAASHYSLAREALGAGKHLLIEKPFTTSSAQAQDLFQEARRQRLVLMAGHLFLYSPALRALKELVDAGELGELRYLYSQRTSLGPRAREEVSVVWDYLVHEAYIMPYLAGGLPEAVSAHGEGYLRPDIADVVFAVMRFPSSVIASCQASWYDPLKVRHLCVVGSRKMAVYDDTNQDAPLVLYDRGYESQEGMDAFGNSGLRRYDRGERIVVVNGDQPLLAQCRAFLEAIAAGRASPEDEAAVLGTLAALEAVDRSLKDGGQWIPVDKIALENR